MPCQRFASPLLTTILHDSLCSDALLALCPKWMLWRWMSFAPLSPSPRGRSSLRRVDVGGWRVSWRNANKSSSAGPGLARRPVLFRSRLCKPGSAHLEQAILPILPSPASCHLANRSYQIAPSIAVDVCCPPHAISSAEKRHLLRY